MRRPVAAACLAAALALLPGCAGTSALEQCVQHSVEEGVDRRAAEQGCRDAGVGRQPRDGSG